MADEKKSITINYSGRDIDRDEFVRRAQAKAIDWMDYQGLQGDERQMFLDSFNSKLAEITGAKLNNSGSVEGSAGIITPGGKEQQSGRRFKTRRQFDVNSSVNTYLTGIANAMPNPSVKSPEKVTTPKGKARTTYDNYIAQSIYGDQDPSEEQLLRWADKYDPVSGTSRGRNGRIKQLKIYLNKYLDEINSGVYRLTDDQKKEEINTINTVLRALDSNDDYEIGKTGLIGLLGNFSSQPIVGTRGSGNSGGDAGAAVTTVVQPDEVTEQSDEVIELSDEVIKELEDELKSIATDYSVTNNELKTDYILPTPTYYDRNIFAPIYTKFTEDPEAYAQNLRHFYESILKIKPESWKQNPNNNQWYDGKGSLLTWELGHDDNSTQDGIDMTSLGIPQEYIDLTSKNDSGPEDTHSSDILTRQYYTANGYQAKFVSDYLNFLAKQGALDKYHIGDNKYLLDGGIDYSKGIIYYYDNKHNRFGEMSLSDPALKKALIDNGNQSTYNELLRGYYNDDAHKSRAKAKKAQLGLKLTLDNSQQETPKQNTEITDDTKFKDRAGSTFWDKLSTSDKANIYALAADLGSMGASYVPGYGTLASLVLGLGSSGIGLWSDLNNSQISAATAGKNFLMNAGMDVVGAIPFGGTGSNIAKIGKSIVRATPVLMSIFDLVGNSDKYGITMKKLASGNIDELDSKDLANIRQVLTEVIGLGQAGAHRMQERYYRGTPNSEYQAVSIQTQNGGTRIVPAKYAQALSKAKTQNEVDAIISVYNKDPRKSAFIEKNTPKNTTVNSDLFSLDGVKINIGAPKRFRAHTNPDVTPIPMINPKTAPKKSQSNADVQLGGNFWNLWDPLAVRVKPSDVFNLRYNRTQNAAVRTATGSPFNKKVTTLEDIQSGYRPISSEQAPRREAASNTPEGNTRTETTRTTGGNEGTRENSTPRTTTQTTPTVTAESIKKEFTVDELAKRLGIQQDSEKLNVKSKFDEYVQAQVDAGKKPEQIYNELRDDNTLKDWYNQLNNQSKPKIQESNNQSEPKTQKSKTQKFKKHANGGMIQKFSTGNVINKEYKWEFEIPGTETTTSETKTDETDNNFIIDPVTDIDRTSQEKRVTWADPTITALEFGKFAASTLANSLILRNAKKMRPVMKDPVIREYRQWSPKQYLDEAQRTKTEYNRLGNLSASNTSDQGTAMAYMLTSKKAGDAAALPLFGKYGEYLTTSVDKAIDTANWNVHNAEKVGRHDVHEGNETARIAKINQDILSDNQFLNHLGTQLVQLKNTIQHGVADRQLAQYQQDYQNFLVTDPHIVNATRKVRELQHEIESHPEWTDEIKQAKNAELDRLTNESNDIMNRRVAWWQQTHIKPRTVPFSLPITSVGRYDNEDYGFNFNFKSGGKMKESEKQKQRHEDKKLFYETQKLLLQESNKKASNMKSGYAYFSKLMMQSK